MKPNWKLSWSSRHPHFRFQRCARMERPAKAPPVFAPAERDAIQTCCLHLNYKLGNHVLLVRVADLTIIDIIKNGGLK